MKRCKECDILGIIIKKPYHSRTHRIYCPKCKKTTLFVDGLKYAKACWDRMNSKVHTGGCDD